MTIAQMAPIIERNRTEISIFNNLGWKTLTGSDVKTMYINKDKNKHMWN